MGQRNVKRRIRGLINFELTVILLHIPTFLQASIARKSIPRKTRLFGGMEKLLSQIGESFSHVNFLVICFLANHGCNIIRTETLRHFHQSLCLCIRRITHLRRDTFRIRRNRFLLNNRRSSRSAG